MNDILKISFSYRSSVVFTAVLDKSLGLKEKKIIIIWFHINVDNRALFYYVLFIVASSSSSALIAALIMYYYYYNILLLILIGHFRCCARINFLIATTVMCIDDTKVESVLKNVQPKSPPLQVFHHVLNM